MLLHRLELWQGAAGIQGYVLSSGQFPGTEDEAKHRSLCWLRDDLLEWLYRGFGVWLLVFLKILKGAISHNPVPVHLKPWSIQ